MYNGNGNKRESYLQTRMRLYQQQKEKSSMSLPPDPDSLLQALKRAQMQTLLWQQCGEIAVKQHNPEQYGWKWDDDANKMVPLWYTGPQLPPKLQKKQSKAKVQAVDTVADDECSDTDVQEPKKKRRRYFTKEKNQQKK